MSDLRPQIVGNFYKSQEGANDRGQLTIFPSLLNSRMMPSLVECYFLGAAAFLGAFAVVRLARSNTLGDSGCVNAPPLLTIACAGAGVVWVTVVVVMGAGAAAGPAARMLMIFFKISNQNVAPSEIAKAVVSQPIIL